MASPASDSTAAVELAAASDKEYSMEDFGDRTVDQAAEEVAAPAAEGDGEPSAEPVVQDGPVLDTPGVATAAPKGSRDYSQFDADTTAALKTMSNKGFSWATKMIETRKAETAALTETRAEVEKLKSGALPESWHSEPEAYKIAPQYAKHESEFMAAQASTHQYANALEALALGEPFDVPGSDGKPISFDPEKLDDRGRIKLKTQLESARTHFYEQQREHATAANQFRDQFKAKYTQAEQIIVREMDRLFPIDAKTQAKEIAFEKQIIDMFPPEFRNHPATKMAAREGVYINKLLAQIAEKDAKIKSIEGLQSDRKLAGGVPKRIGSGSAKGGDDASREYSLKDFEL